jgi:xanthine dehydrogenase large subunit
VKFGISFTATFFNQAGALVLVYRDGSVQVNHGGTEMGQGLHTKIRQIAAEGLGVPAGIDPRHADPHRQGSQHVAHRGLGGHRSERRGGAGCVPADPVPSGLRRSRRRCRMQFSRPNSSKRLTSSASRSSRRATTERPRFISIRKPATGKPFHYYAYAAAVSEVEIDGFTGDSRILRADLLEDVGDSVSPLVDRGQIEGGFVQGLGWLTIEELVWDAQGRLATAALPPTSCPRGPEMPPVFNVSFLERAAEPGVIFGSKAVGEPPLMLAFSVREAIREAIAAFGSGGVVTLDSPATPERIFWAIEAARTRTEAVPEPVAGAVRG